MPCLNFPFFVRGEKIPARHRTSVSFDSLRPLGVLGHHDWAPRGHERQSISVSRRSLVWYTIPMARQPIGSLNMRAMALIFQLYRSNEIVQRCRILWPKRILESIVTTNFFFWIFKTSGNVVVDISSKNYLIHAPIQTYYNLEVYLFVVPVTFSPPNPNFLVTIRAFCKVTNIDFNQHVASLHPSPVAVCVASATFMRSCSMPK